MLKKFFKSRFFKVFLWVHIILLAGAVFAFFHLKYKANKAYEEALTQAPFDAIIVPGYPYIDGWHDIMKSRVLWSVHLWKEGVTKNIIYSGSAVYSPYVESIIMKQYALAMGVPDSVIFEEKQAEHSTENLFYSNEIAIRQNFNSIALATDPFQSYFLQYYAEDRPFDLGYIPVKYEVIRNMDVGEIQIDPEIAFREGFTALPERESFWKRFQGTLGKNVEHKLQKLDEEG